MKNKKSLLIGMMSALLFILFFNGVFQSLIILLLNGSIESFAFTITGFSPIVILETTSYNIYLNSILLLSPMVIYILFMELTLMLLSKTTPDTTRYSLILFLLLLFGYLIIITFYGMIELILFPSTGSLWGRLVQLWELEGGQIYVLVAFILLVLFSYLQITQKRLMQYLVINK